MRRTQLSENFCYKTLPDFHRGNFFTTTNKAVKQVYMLLKKKCVSVDNMNGK